MNREFPREFDALARAPNVRGAFVSEIVSPHPGACQNCGGVGSMFIFVATVGPLVSPAVGQLISHYYDDKWWGGRNFQFPCPVCSRKEFEK